MKIIIVEDDDKLRKELVQFFIMHGYEAAELAEFTQAAEQILQMKGDAVLLDISLPGLDGKYLCKEIRRQSSVPILMITSQNTEMNELLCLNYGADDFISKPFNPQILLAHVEAVLKRSKQKEGQESEKISCGGFWLDVSRGVIFDKEKEIELTKNESRILFCLAKSRGKIVSRDAMMNELWDSEWFVDDNTLNVNITRLRGKLEELGQKSAIHTRRGQGYLLQ